MNELLDQMIITEIEPPIMVHSKKGEDFQMVNRPSFGLSFCCSGQITYYMNDKKYVSKPGNAVLLPKGASYTLSRDKEGLFPLLNFNCEHYDSSEIKLIHLHNARSCIQQYEALQKLFLRNASSLKKMGAFYDLLHSVSEETLSALPLLHSALQYIDENMTNPELSNAAIAAHLNISEVYLRKLFNRYHGTTPKQYLLEKRIQKAMYMLISTAFSITAIAQECGFSSLYHFCRTFKQRTGLTPKEYATQNHFDGI